MGANVDSVEWVSGFTLRRKSFALKQKYHSPNSTTLLFYPTAAIMISLVLISKATSECLRISCHMTHSVFAEK